MAESTIQHSCMYVTLFSRRAAAHNLQQPDHNSDWWLGAGPQPILSGPALGPLLQRPQGLQHGGRGRSQHPHRGQRAAGGGVALLHHAAVQHHGQPLRDVHVHHGDHHHHHRVQPAGQADDAAGAPAGKAVLPFVRVIAASLLMSFNMLTRRSVTLSTSCWIIIHCVMSVF